MAKWIHGSRIQTGPSVVRAGADLAGISLQLPYGIDLAKPDGLKLLNDRLRAIEIAFQALARQEVALPAKAAYGALEAVEASAGPVTGAKVNLDRVGTWSIAATFDWEGSGEAEGYVVVDPETTGGAIRQDAYCRATGSGTKTVTCLFTATKVPRLMQLYAKAVSGSWELREQGTSISATWQSAWSPSDKRFGRQTPSKYTEATDMNGVALTDHGEEARWPRSDNPAYLSEGVALPEL